MTTAPVTACPVCGGTSLAVLGERSDGVAVLQCERCRMGVVAELPLDTAAYYTDAYYSGEPEASGGADTAARAGYSEYPLVAAHSLTWAADLVRLLRPNVAGAPDTKVLDVGCADGYLLQSLGTGYELHGIEVNEAQYRRCAARGIRMLGRDICDPRLRERFAGTFDVITAIATLEHVADLRAALEQMRDLLAPEGVLLFEVPLLSAAHDNGTWFRSSLEHIYYPTVEGLAYLFEHVFGLPLLGREVVIRSYASTFAGVAARSAERHATLSSRLGRLLDAPPAQLDAREREFRLSFELIHAASPTPENLALLAELQPGHVTPALLHRLAALWTTDLARADSLQAALESGGATGTEAGSQEGVDGVEGIGRRLSATQAALEEERARSSELELGRRWLERQFFTWQRVATEREEEIAALKETLEQQVSLKAEREAALEKETQEHSSRTAVLEARLAACEEHIEQLLTSTSWRITAPMRAVGAPLQRARDGGSFRLGPIVWRTARLAYRSLPISGLQRYKLRQWALAWLKVPEETPPQVAVGRLRDLVQGLSWRRARSAAALVLRGDLSALKMHMNYFMQHSVNEETHRAVLTEAPADLIVLPGDEPEWPRSQPLVSIVIPCYNYGHFVSDAVESVLAQTFPDFEILVVDGGSGPESVALLKSLSWPKTQVHYREGRHLVGDNRNFGISRARGKYICCLDADDKLKPTFLEKALFLLETQGYDLVSTSIQCFGGKSEIFHLERSPALADMLQGNHVSTCAVFRRDLWARAGGFQDEGIGSEYIYEDWRLWVRFSALGARFFNIVDEPLFLYRVHSAESLSTQNQAVPSMERQRDAMTEFNRDVLTEEALHLSEENRRLQLRIEEGFETLAGRPGLAADKPTVLVAMPFFIIGGAERLISEVVAHLDAHGYRIILVTTEYVYPIYGDSTAWFEKTTSEIYHLPRFLDAHRWQDFIFYLFETRNISLLWIIGSRVFYELLPRIKSAYPELKVIDLLFNTIGHTASNRRHAQHFDKILVENQEVAAWLLEAGESPEKVLQITSGIDLEAYRPDIEGASASGDTAGDTAGIRAQLGIAPDTFVAGYSGRLSEEKDPEAFLEIARKCRSASQIAFLMTGAGPLSDQIAKRIEATGLAFDGHLRFLGQVPSVKEYMASYDVLILPSRFDGRPVAVLESLALGVPVIASRVGALPDLVQEGVTGFLCEPGDIGAFAERIRWLADHPEEHRRMKVAARAFAEANLDAQRMFERYEEAIREVISAASAMPPKPVPQEEEQPALQP